MRQRIKRPILVWVISAFYVFSTAYTLLSFYLIWSGAITVSQPQRAYFAGLTVLDYLATIITGLLNLSGAIALFLLRRLALYLFLGGFSAGLVLSVAQALTLDWVAALPSGGLIGAILGWLIAIGIILYAWRLARAGVLK